MKVIALVVFALAVFGANADIVSDITADINAILEKIPEPLLDIHDKHYEYDASVEKIELDLDDVVLKGIKAMEIATMEYDESSSRLDYVLNFAAVDFYLGFSLKASGIIEFEHKPTISMDLSDMKLSGYAVLDSAADPTQITDFSVLLTIDGAKFELANILNDDELTTSISKLLNEQFPETFNALTKDLEPVFSPIVQTIINIVLRHI